MIDKKKLFKKGKKYIFVGVIISLVGILLKVLGGIYDRKRS